MSTSRRAISRAATPRDGRRPPRRVPAGRALLVLAYVWLPLAVLAGVGWGLSRAQATPVYTAAGTLQVRLGPTLDQAGAQLLAQRAQVLATSRRVSGYAAGDLGYDAGYVARHTSARAGADGVVEVSATSTDRGKAVAMASATMLATVRAYTGAVRTTRNGERSLATLDYAAVDDTRTAPHAVLESVAVGAGAALVLAPLFALWQPPGLLPRRRRP